MRLGAVFRFELRFQARRPTTWLYAAVFLAGAAGIASNYHVRAAGGGSHFDAPVAVAAAMVVATFAGLLMAAALAADAATRDAATRLDSLIFTTPLRRHEYLGGRFFAAFALYALVLALVPLGFMFAARFLARPELTGTFRPQTYLEAYLLLGLPNAFITTAILFAVAALSRSAVATFVTAVVLFLVTMLSPSGDLAEMLVGNANLAWLFDPFGFGATLRMTAGWTIAQRNALPVTLEGELLWNRIVWVALACAALGMAYWRFPETDAASGRGARSRLRPFASLGVTAAAEPSSRRAAEPPIAVPRTDRRFGVATTVRQTLTIARRAFLDVATSRGALVLVAFAALRVLTGRELLEHMGVPFRATTDAVIRMLTEGDPPPILLIGPAIAIFYAGELVWKDRDTRVAPLTGAAPVGEWAILLGNFLGLALVLAAFQALLVAAGIAVQLMVGAPEVSPALYAATMLGVQLAGLLTIAMVAIVAQVIAGGKYVGWLAAVAAFVITALGRSVGAEHPLLAWNMGPAWEWTELRGFGVSLVPVLWFKAYWAAWAVLLAIVARLFVVRGIDLPWRERLSRARQRFSGRMALGSLGAAGAVCGLGGFIFWNTNVVNEFTTGDEWIARAAEYERRYGGYEGVPQPRLLSQSLRIELYPSERRAGVRARWTLRNETGAPLDTIHLATRGDVETGEVRFDRAARAALVDGTYGHRIYVLASPLLPGDSLALDFELRYAPRGFAARGAADAVMRNGTYVVLEDWLPAVGYQRNRELPDGPARTREGLPPRPRRRPENEPARYDLVGRERVDLDVVIGTDDGETAVAPGVLRRSWGEHGRRYFEYASAAPVRSDAAILSARYAVHRTAWQGIPIEVLYDPDHAWNAERTARSIVASLEYFTRELGPYPFAVVRAVERPGTSDGATAFPGMIAYSGGLAIMHPEEDPRDLDFPFAVMAHEMAHMWWGHQLVPANADGAALLSESLAWYGAFGVVEETYGTAHLGRLLDIMREAYLAPMPRAGVPLVQGHDWFQAYRRGAFAMYSAREYLGEERVSGVLRRFFAAHAAGRPPLPTSLDLYHAIRAETPDSLATLVGDLFERNVWWELETKRADAERLPSGEWRVTLGLNVRRIEADTLRETSLPLDEIVQVGVYGEDPEAGPLYLRTHRIREREPEITVTVPERPVRAGVDPNHLLVDDEPWDNVRAVVVP